MNFIQQMQRLDTLMSALEIVAFGSDADNVSYNGSVRETLAKQTKSLVASSIGDLIAGHEIFQTKALMDADLAHAEPKLATVWNDPVDANNGVYGKTGISGSGAWVLSPMQSAFSAYANGKRGRWLIYGKVDKLKFLSDSSTVVSWSRLYLFDGATSSYKKVAPVTDLVIANGDAAYIDIAAGLNVSGEYDVLTGAPHSSTEFPDTASFIADDKYVLLGNYFERLGGPLVRNIYELSGALSRYQIIGRPEKIVTQADKSVLLTTGELYAFEGSRGSDERLIAAVADLSVPYGGAAYIDFDDAVLTVKTTTDISSSASNENEVGCFVGGSKVLLLVNKGNAYGRLSGVLADRWTEQEQVISRAQLLGGVKKATKTGATVRVSWDKLRLFEGSRGTFPVEVAAVVDLDIADNQAAYIDLNAPLNGSGEYVVQVTGSAYYSEAENGRDGFVRDGKVILLSNDTDRVGGLLAESFSRVLVADPWLGQVVMRTPGTSMTFDAATRTLAWDNTIFFQRSGGDRIKLLAGSVVFPDNQLYVAWLDLNAVVYAGTDPAVAVKVGRYFDGDDRFLADSGQLPFYFYNSGEHGSVGGFPAPVESSDDNDVVVVHTADQVAFYVKGDNSESSRYLKYVFKHFKDVVSEDLDVRHDVWRMYECWEVDKTGSYTFSSVRRLVSGGEWECAIQEVGKSDFMGGAIHGNEFLESVYLLVDGVKREMTASGSYRCKRLELVQASRLTGHGTANATDYAQKYTRWDVSRQAMDVQHHLNWLVVATLDKSYLSMLPIERVNQVNAQDQLTDAGSRWPLWQEEDYSVSGFPHVFTDASYAKIWGVSSGISADVEVLSGWELPNRAFNVANASYYNKFYFDFSGSHVTAVGEKWNTLTRYRIRTAN